MKDILYLNGSGIDDSYHCLHIRLVQICMQTKFSTRFMRHVDRKVHFDLKVTCVKFFIKTMIFRGPSRASKFCVGMVYTARPFQSVNLLHPSGD